MVFQSEEGPHCPPDMVALRSRTSRLAALHPTELLEPSMIHFNCPNLRCHILSTARCHRHHIGGPILRVTVWGVNPEDLDHPKPFQMHHRPIGRELALPKRSIAPPIGIHVPIALERREPVPAQAANGLEVLQGAVPTVEGDKTREKAALFGSLEHGAEVSILGHAVHRLVVKPIVAWDGVCAITPQQGDQVDARDDAMVLARPVAMDQVNLLSIGLIKGSIVDDQEPIIQDNMLPGLVPEWRGGRVETMEQTRESIMSSAS